MHGLRTPFYLAALAVVLSAAAPAWGGPAEDQYAVAAGQYARSRWAAAIQEFEAFLAKYPDHASVPLAKFFLGEALVQQNDFAKARPYFDAFYAAQPTHKYAPQALFRRGEAAYMTGDYPAARELLAKFNTEQAESKLNAYALPYLGDLALMADEPAAAQRYYAAALRQHSDTPLADQCRFGLARALQQQRRFDDAAKFYQSLIAKPNSPLVDDALLQLGRLQFEQGQAAEAAKTLAELSEKYPQSELLPYGHYWTGMTQLAQGDFAAAAASFEAAGGVGAEHALRPAAQFQTGEALRRQGKFDEALARYDAVQKDSPDSPWAEKAVHAQLRIASDRDEHARVIEQTPVFLQKYPHSPLAFDARRLVGRAQLKQGQYDAAIATLEPLVNELTAGAAVKILAHDDLAAASESSRYLLGLAYVGGKKPSEALAIVSALKPDETTNPQFAASVASLQASGFMEQKKFAEAIAPLQTYLRVSPTGPDAEKTRAQLAIAYLESGNMAESQATYAELAKVATDREQFLDTTYYLAERAFKSGDKAWSRELFTTLADEKNPPDVREKGLAGKAWAEFDLNAAARSAETFDKLLAEFPNSPMVPEAALARAAALEGLQQYDAALSMYTLVLEKYPSSKQYADARLRAAKIYDQLQQDDRAAELLAQWIKDYPQRPDLDAALYRYAWVLSDLKRAEEANVMFARISNEFPASRFWPDATYRLAEQASAAGDYPRVAELTSKIAASGTKDATLQHAIYLQGQTAAKTGRWEDVAGPMHELLNKFPDNPQKLSAEYWIAESLYRLNKFDEASQAFEALAQKVTDRTDPWLGMIPLRRGQVLAHKKQWAAALAMAQPVAERFPGFSQQYEIDYLIGRCLSSQAKFNEAREAYQRVVDSSFGAKTETAAMAEWMIGESFFHQKDFDNAVRSYDRVELLYDFPQWQAAAMLQAGKCLELQQKWSDAAERYSQIVTQYPDTTFKEEAERRLATVRERTASNQAGERGA